MEINEINKILEENIKFQKYNYTDKVNHAKEYLRGYMDAMELITELLTEDTEKK